MEGKKDMSSRERILSKIKENSAKLKSSAGCAEEFDMPDFSLISPLTYPDTLEKFKETARQVSGAKVEELGPDEDINVAIKRIYPEAKIIGSHLPEIEADVNPDSIECGKELMKVDVGVVKGSFGVAENGCVWIPQTMKERAICFASENLVILLRKSDVVNNMHEAYEMIEKNPSYFDTYKFGTFISGPSKTADIESALVYGAQAARTVTLFLI